MNDYIQSFFIILLEVLCCKFFYEGFGKKKRKKSNLKNYGIIIALLLFDFFIATFLSNYFILKQILIIICTSFFMYLYIRVSFIKSIILSILYQSLMLAIEYFVIIVISKLFENNVAINELSDTGIYLIIILGKAILFLCIFLLKETVGRKPMETLSNIEWFKFLFFPILTIISIIALIPFCGYVKNSTQENLIFIIAFGLVSMNIMVFYLINSILTREMKIRENELFRLKMKDQTNMYHSISENLEKQKNKAHDYNHQILCIESLLMSKNYDELENYIKSISNKFYQYFDAMDTNHIIINTILNMKYQEAMEKDIIFVLKINDLSYIHIKDTDIVIILSNLLDNAIEACEKCGGKKIIKFKCVHEDNQIVISVKNTYGNPPVLVNGKYKTLKEVDTDEHGIGLRNIIETITKYEGSYVIQDKNYEFFFSAIIPL